MFSGYTIKSDTNQPVHPLKMARGLAQQIMDVERLYYLCRENKGADQLRAARYCTSGLLLCSFPNENSGVLMSSGFKLARS